MTSRDRPLPTRCCRIGVVPPPLPPPPDDPALPLDAEVGRCTQVRTHTHSLRKRAHRRARWRERKREGGEGG